MAPFSVLVIDRGTMPLALAVWRLPPTLSEAHDTRLIDCPRVRSLVLGRPPLPEPSFRRALRAGGEKYAAASVTRRISSCILRCFFFQTLAVTLLAWWGVGAVVFRPE